MSINLKEKFQIYGAKVFFKYSLCELVRIIYWGWLRKSYSQLHEDLIIDQLLNNKKKGFYVDVGANDPSRFSNTKLFYNKGWCGINIEPNVNNYNKLKVKRVRDINLNIGISQKAGIMNFFLFSPDTLSTFCRQKADEYLKQGMRLVKDIPIQVERLDSILGKYSNCPIDFLSIDTEGLDLEVLQSNDWDKYRPKVVCIELGSMAGRLEEYLRDVGYVKAVFSRINGLFLDKNSLLK